MDQEYSLEFAFWGFLKNKSVAPSEIEEYKKVLADILERLNVSFREFMGDAHEIECSDAKEKKLTGYISEYYSSMISQYPRCEIDVSALSKEEFDNLWNTLDSNGVELFVGELFGLNGEDFKYYEEDKIIVCQLYTHDPSYVAIAFAKLLKKANVLGEVKVLARSFAFAYEILLQYKQGKLTARDRKDYFDNHESLEKIEAQFKEQNVTVYLEGLDAPNNPFVIAREYDEVYKQFANVEVTSLMYWASEGRGADSLDYFMPHNFEELKFLWAVAFTSGSKEQMERTFDKFVAVRDGKTKLPADMPEELKRTAGMWIYETQKDAAEAIGLECEFEQPSIEVVAKMNANAMYKFAYLCAKYGVHKNILSAPSK